MVEPDKADLVTFIDSLQFFTEDLFTGKKTVTPVPEFIKNKMRAAVGLPEVDRDGQKRRVRKARTMTFGPPWIVTNHPLGSWCFDTWQQAMDYANSSGFIMNSADIAAIDTMSTNLALYGESYSTITSLADGRNQVIVHDHEPGQP